MNDYLVNMKSVGVNRNDRWLIRDFDLTVRAGEIISIIGPNGAGKTTSIKVIIGLIQPDAGTIDVKHGTRIGYVPQRIFISSTMPLNVRRMMKLTESCSDDEIDAALSHFNILNLADSSVQNLSGGELQRLLFARAILKQPDLLICDEPTQSLDAIGEGKLIEDIVKVRDRINCGIIWISHKLHFVMAKTDNVICLNGHICCTGTPSQLLSNDVFVQLFGNEVVQSLSAYRHHHNSDHRDTATSQLVEH